MFYFLNLYFNLFSDDLEEICQKYNKIEIIVIILFYEIYCLHQYQNLIEIAHLNLTNCKNSLKRLKLFCIKIVWTTICNVIMQILFGSLFKDHRKTLETPLLIINSSSRSTELIASVRGQQIKNFAYTRDSVSSPRANVGCRI